MPSATLVGYQRMSELIVGVADHVIRFLAWMRRNRLLKVPADTELRVNLGPGLSAVEGWINIDASLHALFSKFPRIVRKLLYNVSAEAKKAYSLEEYLYMTGHCAFVHHNLLYGIPFPDETVDYLYSSHFLEHLYQNDAKRLMKEAYRVLKSGGYIRISVPNLEFALSLYLSGDREHALEYFFVPSSCRYFSRHHYMYDFELLCDLLRESGFIDIRRCSFRQGNVPDVDRLDNRPEESLYVEAKK